MPTAVLFAFLLALMVAAGDAQGAIYRCRDAAGGVLYSDEPCSGGVALDVPKSVADPSAIERLRREQEAFDKRQAARDAAATEAARQRDLQYREARRQRAEDEARAQREAQTAYGGYYWGWPWPAFVRPHPQPRRIQRPVHQPSQGRSFLPAR